MNNIEKKFNCTAVKIESKIPFDATKVAEYLKIMIPFIRLPADYRLKVKPIYLTAPQRRRGPIRSRTTSNGNSKVLTKNLMDAIVVLENCDGLIENYAKKGINGMTNGSGHDKVVADDVDLEPIRPECPIVDLHSSDTDETIIISDEDGDLTKATVQSDSEEEIEEQNRNLKPLKIGKRKTSHWHGNSTRLVSLAIEPMILSKEDKESEADDDETVSNHSRTALIPHDDDDDEIVREHTTHDDFIPEFVTYDTNKSMADNATECNENVSMRSHSLDDEYVPLSHEQVTTLIASRTNSEDLFVSCIDNAIGAEELIGENIEQNEVVSAEDDAMNHNQSNGSVQLAQTHYEFARSEHENEQSENEDEVSEHRMEHNYHEVSDKSMQTLRLSSAKMKPMAQSTPLIRSIRSIVTDQPVQSSSADASTQSIPIDKPNQLTVIEQPAQMILIDPTPIDAAENNNNEMVAHQDSHGIAAENENDATLQLQLDYKKVFTAYQNMKRQTEEALKRLESQAETITRLESNLMLQTNNLVAKENELANVKMDHVNECDRLMKTIDETKRKLWCRICNNEVVKPFHGLLVCSFQCLQTMW